MAKSTKSSKTQAKAEVKKTEAVKVEEHVFECDYEKSYNEVLLNNRYNEAMELNAKVAGDDSFKKAKEWKFIYVGVGGSFAFMNGGRFAKADADHPEVVVRDYATAKSLIDSNKFRIVSYK